MSAGVIIIAVMLLRALIAHQRSRNGGVSSPSRAKTGRAWLWLLLVVGWIGFIVYTLATTLDDARPVSIALAWKLAVIATGASLFFFAWPILHALTRLGRPKLVYRLAHVALLFPSTGETYSGGCLLALLALARRGDVTAEERAWVKERLLKEQRHLGTYATACALHLWLEARAARDDGRLAEAQDLTHRGRIVLGTVTYASDLGVPRPVRKVVFELLGLDDARLGRWGTLEIAPEKALSPLSRALRAWTRERMMKKPAEPKAARLRRRLDSPLIEKLYARDEALPSGENAKEMLARAQRDFQVLAGGGAIGPRNILNLLVRFDLLMHPEFPETLLPEAIRSDEELVASIHEDVAAALTEPILREGAPLFAMNQYGPVSARVYQRVEAALLGEMDRMLRTFDERTKAGLRGYGPFDEWLEASQLRSIYRRIEMALGPEAVASVYPYFAYTYGNLGVMFAETEPRMRPLAHAIFKCLSGEAARFEDQENIKQQAHNLKVTAGAD